MQVVTVIGQLHFLLVHSLFIYRHMYITQSGLKTLLERLFGTFFIIMFTYALFKLRPKLVFELFHGKAETCSLTFSLKNRKIHISSMHMAIIHCYVKASLKLIFNTICRNTP